MPFLRRRSHKSGRQVVPRSIRTVTLLGSVSFLAFWLLSHPFGTTSTQTNRQHSLQPSQQIPFAADVSCIAWRKTDHCSPFGLGSRVRIPAQDSDCQTWIKQGSGYCQCSARRTVKRLHCGRHTRFRCEDECRQLKTKPASLQSLPFNITCSRGVPSSALQFQAGSESNSIDDWDALASSLWSRVVGAVDAAGRTPVTLPEVRSEVQDWVRDGLKLPKADVQRAQAQWRRYILEAPEYPGFFRGRGIAILAGGPQYMVPAWVNVKMLRRTGCQLPVEMLFPAAEYPTPELVAALAKMGVTCRMLPDVVVQSSRKAKHPDSKADLVVDPMSGFTMKIAAVILSSFQEVIFLDSDNVAIDNVDPLFDNPHYRESGALLWPDYWASSAAPDVREILGLKSLPEGTSESGQMVFDKMRVWDALVLAAYFNMNSGFYYEMFSNFMGKGDKESFSFAFAATQTPYFMVPHPVGSLGVMRHYCSPDQSFCWEEFTGNTMTQYSPSGQLMFLHTNLSPKWNLMVPGNFEAYTRRWQVLVPGPHRFSRMEAEWGRDVEFEIWQSIADFRCADFFRRYIEEYERVDSTSGRGLRTGLQGFHPQNEGVNFRQAYRWGLRGSYLKFTPVNVGDGMQHFKNTRIKPFGAWYRRVVLRMLQRNTYFRLW